MKEHSEKQFHAWLDKLLVAHVFIHSETGTFAKAFRQITKRADFIIFPDGKKPYCVDVKEKRLEIRNGFTDHTFEITHSDIKKLAEFQKLYSMRVWLALTPDHKKDEWYFIDLYHVNKLPPKYREDSRFVYIPYSGSSVDSAYLYRDSFDNEEIPNKRFFINYLTKNSPKFKI